MHVTFLGCSRGSLCSTAASLCLRSAALIQRLAPKTTTDWMFAHLLKRTGPQHGNGHNHHMFCDRSSGPTCLARDASDVSDAALARILNPRLATTEAQTQCREVSIGG
jgi:hypothetical protein